MKDNPVSMEPRNNRMSDQLTPFNEINPYFDNSIEKLLIFFAEKGMSVKIDSLLLTIYCSLFTNGHSLAVQTIISQFL